MKFPRTLAYRRKQTLAQNISAYYRERTLDLADFVARTQTPSPEALKYIDMTINYLKEAEKWGRLANSLFLYLKNESKLRQILQELLRCLDNKIPKRI